MVARGNFHIVKWKIQVAQPKLTVVRRGGGTDLLSVKVYLTRFDNLPAEIARYPMVPGSR